MPLSYYPGMDDRNNANLFRTISPSVPPADHGIPPADHGIPPADYGIPPANHGRPVPLPSPDKSKMLPPPTSSIKGKKKEKDGSNVGGLLMDLAEGGSEDGTSTPTEKDAGTVPPAPTEKDASTVPPAPTEKDTGTTLPAPTGEETSTTPDKPNDPKQMGTPKPDWHATPGSESSCSDDDDTEDEEYVSGFLEWLGLDPDCKRMMDDETKMLAHH